MPNRQPASRPIDRLAYPAPLEQLEAEVVTARRVAAQQPGRGDKGLLPADTLGVGVSGGGVRLFRWLREVGRYLAPRGSGDVLLLGAILLRNWVGVQLVLITNVLTAFVAVQTLRVLVEPFWTLHLAAPAGVIWWSPASVLPLLSFVVTTTLFDRLRGGRRAPRAGGAGGAGRAGGTGGTGGPEGPPGARSLESVIALPTPRAHRQATGPVRPRRIRRAARACA